MPKIIASMSHCDESKIAEMFEPRKILSLEHLKCEKIASDVHRIALTSDGYILAGYNDRGKYILFP